MRCMVAAILLVTVSAAWADVPDWDFYPLAVGNEWTYVNTSVSVGDDSMAEPRLDAVFSLRVLAAVDCNVDGETGDAYTHRNGRRWLRNGMGALPHVSSHSPKPGTIPVAEI